MSIITNIVDYKTKAISLILKKIGGRLIYWQEERSNLFDTISKIKPQVFLSYKSLLNFNIIQALNKNNIKVALFNDTKNDIELNKLNNYILLDNKLYVDLIWYMTIKTPISEAKNLNADILLLTDFLDMATIKEYLKIQDRRVIAIGNKILEHPYYIGTVDPLWELSAITFSKEVPCGKNKLLEMSVNVAHRNKEKINEYINNGITTFDMFGDMLSKLNFKSQAQATYEYRDSYRQS